MDVETARDPPPGRPLREEYLLLTLLAVGAGLTIATSSRLSEYPALVDWPTIAALAGLLVLTKGVERAGFLHHLGFRLITRMRTERKLALFLAGASALLATVLTNDIALFIVVPLTLSLHAIATLPTVRLVVFEALAVNVGSTLTPVGNPQNLFLWQQSGTAFRAFVWQLLPLTATLAGTLAVFILLAFRRKPVETTEDARPPPLDRPLLLASVALYPPFLVSADLHHAGAGLAAVLAVFLLRFRAVLKQVDWALLAVFILMFVDLRVIAQLAPIRELVARVPLAEPRSLYLAGVAISQIISNVPGAILLSDYSSDWRSIAYGVNVGGFGCALGSLANLIALRMLRLKGAWTTFHIYSLPYLLLAGTLVYFGLFAR